MADARWHVLGAGAIGCLFAESLHGGGAGVTLLLRAGCGDRTLVIERGGTREETSLPCADAAACGPITHLLVATKAYDVRRAVDDFAQHLQAGAVLVLMVNGMGIAEALRAERPGLRICCAVTTEGAYRLGPLHIRHAGRGETRLGEPGVAGPPGWFDPWARGVLHCRWEPGIEAALWSKLAVNCVINPLTALHRCRNGELATRPDLRAEVAALCREVSQVSYAAGYTETAQTLAATVARVIAGTASNRSSMLQDVERGQPTEIDYITGYLLRVARDHGIHAPHNTALMQQVRAHAP